MSRFEQPMGGFVRDLVNQVCVIYALDARVEAGLAETMSTLGLDGVPQHSETDGADVLRFQVTVERRVVRVRRCVRRARAAGGAAGAARGRWIWLVAHRRCCRGRGNVSAAADAAAPRSAGRRSAETTARTSISPPRRHLVRFTSSRGTAMDVLSQIGFAECHCCVQFNRVDKRQTYMPVGLPQFCVEMWRCSETALRWFYM